MPGNRRRPSRRPPEPCPTSETANQSQKPPPPADKPTPPPVATPQPAGAADAALERNQAAQPPQPTPPPQTPSPAPSTADPSVPAENMFRIDEAPGNELIDDPYADLIKAAGDKPRPNGAETKV